MEKQSDEEIETDILEIQKLLAPKRIVILSHYNSKFNGAVLPARNALINLLESICKKHDIPFINPTDVLSQYPQEKIMSKDLSHYTKAGIDTFVKFMDVYISK